MAQLHPTRNPQAVIPGQAQAAARQAGRRKVRLHPNPHTQNPPQPQTTLMGQRQQLRAVRPLHQRLHLPVLETDHMLVRSVFQQWNAMPFGIWLSGVGTSTTPGSKKVNAIAA